MPSKIYFDLSGGIKMPAVGLGTWQASDEELEEALSKALELGYRHIDTAYLYGTEPPIGRVLEKWISSGKIQRSELFITTKLPSPGLHEDAVEYFLKKSLANLQLDYVDLYLIHSPVGMKFRTDKLRPDEEGDLDFNTDLVAVWKKLEKQVETGLAKSIGISNFKISQIEKILGVAKIRPACLQIEIHAFLQQHELVDYCQKNGIVVVAYSPLGSPGYNSFFKSNYGDTKQLPNILGNSVVQKISEKHRKTPAQVLLRHTLQRGVGVVPKSTVTKELAENINVFDFSLDNEDMELLFALDIGPSARICDFKRYKGFYEHPECPF